MKKAKKKLYLQQKKRYLKKIVGNSEKPRLAVYRSHKHIYGQLIDDQTGHTLAFSSTLNKSLELIKGNNQTAAYTVGQDLGKKAIEMKIPFLPGISNSSDIMNLINLDYKFFKFFPAQAAGGIEYLKSLSGPFPEIMFCPTGGITQENANKWLSQKNVICVGGSWIVPSQINDYNEIRKRALLASNLSN